MQEMISYKIYGTGAPVLLIHGFGEDSRIWNHQIDFLKTYCQLIGAVNRQQPVAHLFDVQAAAVEVREEPVFRVRRE